MLLLDFLTIQRSAKTRKPIEESKRNEGVILAPNWIFVFLACSRRRSELPFVKMLAASGQENQQKETKVTNGSWFESERKKSLFPLLPSVKLFHQQPEPGRDN